MSRVSTHPVLTLFLCGEFLLHIPCCLHFYAWSFSYTSRAVLIFMQGVSVTHPVLASFLYLGSFSYTSRAGFFFYRESFSYTSHAGFVFFFHLGSFSNTSRAAGFLFFIRRVSLTHPVLASFLSGEFLLHIPCWLHFYLGSFSYTSRAAFNLSVNFPGSYISHAGFIFIGGVSLTHPVLVLFLCREFLLHIPCCFHFFAQGVCLTHPMLPSFLCGEFLLHIPSCLHFYVWSFSYTSHAGFFLCGEFLLHTPSWLLFYMGSFSYTSRTGFFSCEELFSSTVYSEDNPLRKELGGSWPRRKLWKSHSQTREGSPRTTWTEQNETK